MNTFLSTLNTTLLLLIFILIGYLLRKKKLLPESTDAVLSKLENMIFVPAVVISTFVSKCSIENLCSNWKYIMFSLLLIVIEIPCAYVIGRMLGRNNIEERIFRYSITIPNFSFFGIPLISGTFGEEMLFSYLLFCLPMYVVCYSIGTVWLIPSEDSHISLKSFWNPICVSLVIGLVLGLLGFKMPPLLNTAFTNASSCMGPVAMILTGFVVAGYDIRELLGDIRIYIMAALRLLILPFTITFIMKMLSVDKEILAIVMCFLAMPLGLNTIVIPAAYGGDTKIGASCALISSVLAVITIPLLVMILM